MQVQKFLSEVSEAYDRLWEVDDNELTIIMMTIPKESCAISPIIAFVLNPHGKIFVAQKMPLKNVVIFSCKNDIIDIQYDSGEGNKANDHDNTF
ncbi:44847_t:CDS:2 [Gigaspora margarita]|uniref:44847_t:CDS:1 n=1 Tax=Gigaspora margarita TaxID=4874 RepID=A0ABN7UHX6_GIGMA|nr:44847_t:CDS:2 [Gigaspora margarita]